MPHSYGNCSYISNIWVKQLLLICLTIYQHKNRFHYPGELKTSTPPSNLSSPKRGVGVVTTSSVPSWPMSLTAARLSTKSLLFYVSTVLKKFIENLKMHQCKKGRMREWLSLLSHYQDIKTYHHQLRETHMYHQHIQVSKVVLQQKQKIHLD